MDDFYKGVDPDQALEIEQLARLAFELRNNRQQLLGQYGAETADDLLARIRTGELAEHPAYDHYLSARILDETREVARASLAHLLGQGEPHGSLHLELAEAIAERFATQLEREVEIKQDALLLQFDNGIVLEIRYAAPDAYAFNWSWGDAELRIDTAPEGTNRSLSHFHNAAGEVLTDPLTRVGAQPMENLSALISALLADPLLEGGVWGNGSTP